MPVVVVTILLIRHLRNKRAIWFFVGAKGWMIKAHPRVHNGYIPCAVTGHLERISPKLIGANGLGSIVQLRVPFVVYAYPCDIWMVC
ncbi:hypothetical protein FJZ31_11295 [Candidatus Poribacteria bacterium]|nr:hypothetical protein [Candidatus Poribacteria bacterium]